MPGTPVLSASKLSWQEIAADKRKRQAATIPKDWIITPPSDDVKDVSKFPETCGLLSAHEITITNADVPELLEKLAKGEWSSVDVTTAFSKRAVVAHQLTNCLTEIFVEQGIARAKELDKHLKETGKTVGPLHGLPISLKDQFCIKGLETIMGYVDWVGQFAKHDAVLVQILYECGAVLFVRTNLPQTLMWPECFNNVFGRTSNPHNRTFTTGGSSGGEGALISMRGSPLGVGTDIGGSIRIPASFCGTYAIRPCSSRIPYGGAVTSLDGQESVMCVIGPLSTSLEGCKIFMKSVIDKRPWDLDPIAYRKKWDADEYALVDHGKGEGPLCFGLLWNDGLIKPHPPIIRALETTKKALEAAGHKVIDWVPLNHGDIYANISAIWAAGADEDYATDTKISGEPVIKTMAPDNLESKMDKLGLGFRPETEAVSAYGLWKLQKQKRTFKEQYLAHWKATKEKTGTGRPVDAIISPVCPWAGAEHGSSNNADYTMVWNAMDYSVCILPVTKVDPQVDAKEARTEFFTEKDKEAYKRYDPKKYENTPVGIQVVGRTHEEEATLAMSDIVDKALKAFSG